jgi:hypothetical protein
MYTGTLINHLLALVERAEHNAKAGVASQETKFFSGAPARQEGSMQHASRDLTARRVPEGAWSEPG